MATNTPTSDIDSDERQQQSTDKHDHETTVEMVGGEVFFEPASARFEIGKVRGAELVDITIRNDALSLRSMMNADQADRIGHKLIEIANAAREDADE